MKVSLCEKFLHSEFFWSVFSRIWAKHRDTQYLSVFSPNAGKNRPENLRIQKLFIKWMRPKVHGETLEINCFSCIVIPAALGKITSGSNNKQTVKSNEN